MFSQKRLTATITILLIGLAVFMDTGLSYDLAVAQDSEGFTTDFRLEACNFKTKARNPYFILQPNYQLVLEAEEDGEEIRVVISVLTEVETINLAGIGRIKTRVVEEREWEGGDLIEVSRNFFARCAPTNDIYYFGEEVDIYEDGEIVSHDGAWRAGQNGAQPGLMMPGTFLLGSRYFQEIAPDVALDRAEHVAMGLPVGVPAGQFDRCVEVLETTPLEPGHESVKRYCPGVGLVFDDGAELVDFGRNIFDVNEPDDDEEEED
jgi:hypothetical protein